MLTALLAFALAGAPQDSTHLVIAATADIHGRAMGWDYVADAPATGGVARVAAVFDSLRAQYPGQVLAVDAGDALRGDPFATYAEQVARREPHPMIDAMNVAGYDVAAPGGGDLELGVDGLRRAFTGAAFPYVNANVTAASNDTSLYPRFVVLQRGSLRVAVTGFASPDLIRRDDRVRNGLRIGLIRTAAPRTLETMRASADVAVALVSSKSAEGAITLAKGAARPDLVVVGRAQRALGDSVVNDVHVVQPWPGAMEVVVAHLWLERTGGAWRVRRTRIDFVSAEQVAPAPRLAPRLATDHAGARAWAQEMVGRTSGAFPAVGARAGASALADFMGDALRRRTGAELAAVAVADLGAGLPRGEIRRANVLALYPFDHTVLAVRISGAQLKEYLEHAARYYHVDAVGQVRVGDVVAGQDFDIVGGARYDVNLRAPVGSRIVGLAVRGRPVQASDSFTMAMSNARHAGIGGYTMVTDAPVVYDRGEYVRDVLVDEIARRGMLDPREYADASWRLVPASAEALVRAQFGLPDETPPLATTRPDSTVARVLAIGDLRGRFEALPKLKTFMDSLAHECRCAAIRLATGDVAPDGALANSVLGRATLDLLRDVGLVASAIGERELEWSTDTLRQRIAASGYPWLAANIFDSATGRRPEWSEPYRIVTVGGLRVAVIGYVTAAAADWLSAERAKGLRFIEGVLPLKGVLDEVRAAQPNVTVLIAHAGTAEVERLANVLPRGSVNFIIAGHDDAAAPQASGVPVIRARADGDAVVVADVVLTATGAYDIRIMTPLVPSEIGPDAALASRADRFQRQVDSMLAHPVASLKLPLSQQDRRLGQVVAEAWRNALRADVALVDETVMQAGLVAGSVAYRELLRVHPLGRRLVAVTLTGAQVREAFEYLVRGEALSAHVAGLRVRYDPKRPAGRRVRNILLPNGRELRRDAAYRVVTDDAMLGASGWPLRSDIMTERSDVLDADALARYLGRLSQPVEVVDRPGFISLEP